MAKAKNKPAGKSKSKSKAKGKAKSAAAPGPGPGHGRILVGVGGWNFAPWRETFYPEGVTQARELHYASRALTSIEINSTFYGLQKPATFAKWRDETPDGFVFSVKAPRFVTNRKRLGTAGPSIERFLQSGVLELGDKLGAINWQLAPNKVFDPEDLTAFLSLLPRELEGRRLRHALEVRHASFDSEILVQMARAHQVAIVEAGDSEYPRIPAQTASFSYLRIMGTKLTSPKGYPPEALNAWLEHARTRARDGDVYLYFISGAKELNPLAARELLAKMGSDPVS
jgi:uncharacterized protein YecE (DUF72 family)